MTYRQLVLDVESTAHRRFPRAIAVLLACVSVAIGMTAQAQVVMIDQGSDWTPEAREQFYIQDQGSRIMPLAWMQALTQPDSTGFLADNLDRYGYLPGPQTADTGLPIGFAIASEPGGFAVGMTCSACHTRQIEVKGTAYRIDGGPAVVEFQTFLSDLNAGVAAVLATPEALETFTNAVLGAGASDDAKAKLKVDLEVWHLRFDTLVARSLPDPAWGPSRLDAVSMIFNRLAGLDMGVAPDFLIADNITKADAPARYPFLWNAAIQDKTQWPGFADNGNAILGLARNLGEVYGVFGRFHPAEQSGLLQLDRDYLVNNSANFDGLERLEELIRKIGAPKWPWQMDQHLASEGAEIFERSMVEGGCVECHGIQPGETRPFLNRTWATPILDVGTDARACAILDREVKTGVMSGAKLPIIGITIKPTDTAFNLLRASAIGAIVQQKLGLRSSALLTEDNGLQADQALPPELDALSGALRLIDEGALSVSPSIKPTQPSSGCACESRVLEGIWAAAPYLHNGSVASLADLLKPAAERAAAFKLGPEYDLEAIGLSPNQTRFDYTLQTTDCSNLTSGNSRCGHEYGTDLSAEEKAALLEYLKSL